ncbi:hypothetical protein F8M41_007481 [Gigaspora margarita]|uniref:Uncharacterized protein n=1 Tax=Gigaspora margarita TaxID=4874 RepID=A0A8H3X4V7_GIGMA|nr:hypothetical protein F8M41_007481 [Gigaspora margarita]
MNAIEEQLTKDEKSMEINENIQKHLYAIKKRIPTFKAALTNAIKKTYEVTATAKDAHLVLEDGRTSAIRHENSLYQRLLHFLIEVEANINHEKIDKILLRDLKYSIDDLNTPHPKLPDVTSHVVVTPNKGCLTDFLWVDGEYITELSYIMGKYINGIEIKTNSGRSTGWQGSQSGQKE